MKVRWIEKVRDVFNYGKLWHCTYIRRVLHRDIRVKIVVLASLNNEMTLHPSHSVVLLPGPVYQEVIL